MKQIKVDFTQSKINLASKKLTPLLQAIFSLPEKQRRKLFIELSKYAI